MSKELRDRRVTIKVTQNEYAAVKSAAAMQGLTISSFIRRIAVMTAKGNVNG